MKVLCTSTKIRTNFRGRRAFHSHLFGALQSTILIRLKIYKRFGRVTVIR